MNNFYKYIFVSHSSKDWRKVRIIRNYIEDLKFYPLLFHLKCLEKDPLLVKDKNKLKRILREEIASRGRFLLCNSKNSRESEFVSWEVKEVKKYSNIIMDEINLDTPMYCIKSQLKNWMTQLNTIAFIYTWKGRKLCTKVVSRLNQIDNELKFVFFEDDGHIPVFYGALPQCAIDYINEQCKCLSNASIIVPLITNDYYERGFCGMAECISIQKYKNLVVPIYLDNVSNEQLGFQTINMDSRTETDDNLVDTVCEKILFELYK